MKIVAGLREGRHNGVHADLRTQTAIHGELVVGEGLDLAKTKAALDADQLYGHVLSDKWAGAGEGLHNTLIEGARIPGTQRVALQIDAAVTHSNLKILQRLMATAAACGDAHHVDSLWREQIDAPPWRWLLLGLRALLTIGILNYQNHVLLLRPITPAKYVFVAYLISRFAVVGIASRTTARVRTLVDGLAVGHIDAAEGEIPFPAGARIALDAGRAEQFVASIACVMSLRDSRLSAHRAHLGVQRYRWRSTN